MNERDEMISEYEHWGQHDFYRGGPWQKCHGCDYWEPIAMNYLPDDGIQSAFEVVVSNMNETK